METVGRGAKSNPCNHLKRHDLRSKQFTPWPPDFAVLSELPGVSDSGRGMKGSGTAKSGGLESRISFVFSAGEAAMGTLERTEGKKGGGTEKERKREG